MSDAAKNSSHEATINYDNPCLTCPGCNNNVTFTINQVLAEETIFCSKCNAKIKLYNNSNGLIELVKSIKESTKIIKDMTNDLEENLEIKIDIIDRMIGLEFEHFLCDFFTKNGYEVEITKGSGDQGADLIIAKSDERIAIQAKRYSGSVSNSAIQEIVAAKAHYNCSKAMVITNSYFTKSAIELADSNKVELWDRDVLTDKLKSHNNL